MDNFLRKFYENLILDLLTSEYQILIPSVVLPKNKIVLSLLNLSNF